VLIIRRSNCSILHLVSSHCAVDSHLQSVTVSDAVKYSLTPDDEYNGARNM